MNNIVIQIPNSVIKNERYYIDDRTFSVYVYLKYLEFRSQTEKGHHFKVWHKEIMIRLGIGDNRTFKKCLDNLYRERLIREQIHHLPNNNIHMIIQLTENSSEPFTQLPRNILRKVDDIGFIGLRLLYYYESFINRKTGKDHAYPSQDTIKKDLKYAYSTIDKYNKTLIQYKLLRVIVHDFILDGYDELDKPIFSRFNNHYYVLVENINKERY